MNWYKRTKTMKYVSIGIPLSLIIGYFAYTFIGSSNSYKITVEISKIRNSTGQVKMLLFKDHVSFENNKPYKVFYTNKKQLSDGKMTYVIQDIPSGTYGMSLVDDENHNNVMDFGTFKPKEGFAFSNYYHKDWTIPKFKNFKFTLKEDKTIKMIVRYM